MTLEPRLAARFPSSPWYELCCCTTVPCSPRSCPCSQRSFGSKPSARTASVHFRDILPPSQVSTNSGTRALEDRSTSGSISSTNHLSPLLRTRGSGGLFGALWRSLASSTAASCNRLRISANLKLLRTSTSQVLNHRVNVDVKISCHQVHPRRFVRSHRSPSPSTGWRCHHTDGHERFNQAVRSHLLRYHVRVRSGFLVRCGGFGPSTAFPS